MGNLASVAKACRFLGAQVRVTDRPADIRRAAGVIFPGVGAFGAAMRELKRRRLMGPIQEVIREGKPFLGLCLGLQLLLESSEESPGVKGLGVLPGVVRRLPARRGLKIPHMGWNQIFRTVVRRASCVVSENTTRKTQDSRRKTQNSLLDGVPDGAFMYFVHSYYVRPEDPECVAGTTEYGVRFPSVIWNGRNVWATQFHPEKSQRWGLRILKNFLRETHADHSCH